MSNWNVQVVSVLCVLVLLMGGSAQSQVSVTAINELKFDAVFSGVPKTVSKSTAGKAAEFLVTGNAGDEVTIDFQLPQYMSAGGFNMPLVFQDTDCAMDSSASPDQSNPGYDDLDPKDLITYRLGSSGITIWLGGTLLPRMSQPPGSYTAPIVLTVTPTGN